VPEFHHTDVLPLGPDDTEYRQLDLGGITPLRVDGRDFLRIEPATLTGLVKAAVTDIQHLLRPSHLAQLRANLDAVDVHLTDAQTETLDKASAPQLGFPAPYAAHSQDIGFAGATVDGVPSRVNSMLEGSAVRY